MGRAAKRKQKTGQATAGIEKSPARLKRDAARRRREEQEWAARSGPVEVRQVDTADEAE